MSNLIPKSDLPEMENETWKIEKFTVDNTNNFRETYQMLQGKRYTPNGTYTRLLKDKYTCVMSDTPDELRDHSYFVQQAKGNLLIAGLGLGIVLNACALKKEVNHITIIEISKSLIDMIAPHFKKKFGNKITIVNADIFEWKPDKKAYYDSAWYDIWVNLCVDNLKEITKLHRKFGRKTGYQDSWGKNLLRYQKQKENEYNF